MEWTKLTSPELKEKVEETGVCILAMGVVEKHGEHLPLGTDYLNAYKLAVKAAAREPSVVFPPFYFGQVYEARCFPGAVTLEPELLYKVVQGVIDEIGRNGFEKIIILNGHGGNTNFIKFLAQAQLWEEKDYSLYLPLNWQFNSPEEREEILDTEVYGHAGEYETSISLANHEELVKKDKIPDEFYNPQKRMKDLPPTFTGIHWYSDYPEHYVGDAAQASRKKGEALLKIIVNNLAEYIKAVKADKVVAGLEKEFFQRVDNITE
ncbi:MAG: creatininase family protein [Bacillota bacterium]